MSNATPGRWPSKRTRRAVVCGTLTLAALATVAGVRAMAPVTAPGGESAYAESFSIAPGTTLALHHQHGSVTVQGWDRPDVRLEARYAVPEGDGDSTAPIQIDRNVSGWKVNSGGSISASDRDAVVHIALRVPRATPLDLNVKNGALTVTGLEAPVTALTGNGSIVCEHVSKNVRAETRNGNIECRYVLGRIRARTGNGSILVDERHVAEARPLDLVSENGSVRVVLPENAGFELDAHAQQGRVRTDFRPDGLQGFGLRRVVGAVAGGGPGILLRALNGTVRIDRG